MRARLLLASASPRRAELLGRIGLDLDVRPAGIDETAHDETPEAYVSRVAREKAHAARAAFPQAAASSAALLAADTIVVCDGLLLGKPADADAARAMLRRLAGKRHSVLTAYHLMRALPDGGIEERARTVESRVTFRPLSEAEREAYIRSGEWQGKAGAYAVQGQASAFVRTIEGSYTGVVGLPLCEVCEDLMALGIIPFPPYPPEDAAVGLEPSGGD